MIALTRKSIEKVFCVGNVTALYLTTSVCGCRTGVPNTPSRYEGERVKKVTPNLNLGLCLKTRPAGRRKPPHFIKTNLKRC